MLAGQSSKITRVVKSTLAAEFLSLSNALDYTIYLWHIILELTGLKDSEILITAYVDKQSVAHALYSTKEADDK